VVKARDAQTGTRHHSVGMTKEYMDRIMAWLNFVCPEDLIIKVLGGSQHSDMFKVMKHLLMHAFGSSAWTLWT